MDNGEGWQVGAMTQDEEMANELMITAAMGKGGSKMKTTSGFGEGAITALSTEEKLINPHTGEVETEDVRAERLRIEKEAKMSPEELKTVRVPGENKSSYFYVLIFFLFLISNTFVRLSIPLLVASGRRVQQILTENFTSFSRLCNETP